MIRTVGAALLRGALVASFAVAGLAAVTTPAQAADAEDFEAGLLITDALFFDGKAMTASEINSFIDEKNPGCTSGRTCLENYSQDITAKAATSRCDAIAAKSNQNAGQIIAAVGEACGISPKAILVILQKEQSLVTSSAPSTHAWWYAMGAGCPDSTGCTTPNTGFYEQVYYGASLLKGYTLPSSSHYNRYAAGTTSAILYDTTAGCGTKDVYVQNQATHALYVYTPYTPNQAALDNLYGTGDNCSAYGNRNFWRIFTDWFGSTKLGNSLVKTANNDKVYLLTPSGRYTFDGDASVSDFSGLGAVATVSWSLISSFDNLGSVGHFVEDQDTGKVWAIDDGKRYVVEQCDSDLATGLGIDCASIPVMQRSELMKLEYGAVFRPLVETRNGELYYLDADGRHAVTSVDALADSGVSYSGPTMTGVAWSLIRDGEAAPVLLAEGDAVTRGSGVLYRLGDSYGMVGTELWAQANLSNYLSKPLEISSASWVTPDYQWLSGFIEDETTGTVYMFRKWGLTVVDPESIPQVSPNVVASELVPEMPIITTGGMSTFLTDAKTGTTYLTVDGSAREVPRSMSLDHVANTADAPNTSSGVPSVVLRKLGFGPELLPFGTVIENADTGERWFVDGANTAWKAYTRRSLELTSGEVLQVPASVLESYDEGDGYMTLGVSCLRADWLIIGGERYLLSSDEASHYAAALGFSSLYWPTCRAVPEADTEGSRLVTTESGTTYLITGGVLTETTLTSSLVAQYGEPIQILDSTVVLLGGAG